MREVNTMEDAAQPSLASHARGAESPSHQAEAYF